MAAATQCYFPEYSGLVLLYGTNRYRGLFQTQEKHYITMKISKLQFSTYVGNSPLTAWCKVLIEKLIFNDTSASQEIPGPVEAEGSLSQ
jgi:hypothetical protein